MRYDLFRFAPGRDPHAPAHAGLSVFVVIIVGACAALVATSTLVALTHGWDYRLAVMLGAVLAAALARLGWRSLPAERVADRLSMAFAGTLGAALFCVYASDWLDWRPLGLDDAVAGMTIGLLLLLAGPLRRVLHHASEVPTAASLAAVAVALAPATWAAFVYSCQRDALGAAASYALIEAPGFAAALAVTGLGFWFALRRRLYAAAIALSPVAWLESTVLAADGGAPLIMAVLVGGIVGTVLTIASVNAWVRSAGNAPVRLGRIPASVLLARATAILAGPARRALRSVACASNVAFLAAFAVLAAVVAALAGLFDDLDRGLMRAIEGALLGSPGREIALATAALVLVVALRYRLPRTAMLASAGFGIAFTSFDLPYRFGIPDMTTLVLLVTIVVGPPLAARAAWRASASGAPARPSGVLLVLAAATVVTFMAEREPLEYFFAAATLGVWWWFYYRRGVPLIAPERREHSGRRQRLLRLALAASFAATLGVHLLLLEAAEENATGPEMLVLLRTSGLYRVSDVAFARAMLADQYLWRDSVPARRGSAAETSPEGVLQASRYRRDRWSSTSYAWWVHLIKERRTTGYGMVAEEARGGRRVSYVYEGSPAFRAGVRRGDVIRAVDGVALDQSDSLWPPGSGGARLELRSARGEVREVTVTPGEYERSTVSAERVIDVAGRRVGYLELHNFHEEAASDFMAAAARLQEQGIDELVLDLRMNPGGYVEASRRIASAIGGKRLDGNVYVRVTHNDRYHDLDEDLAFSAPERGVLSLPRVFIITSKKTCSASESLINGLAPHMEVVTVGSTTCGKPVGYSPLAYGELYYAFISFRVTNARGEGDYYDGLRPTCAAENDPTRDLGDPEEASLKAALYYIRHGRCPETGANPGER